MIAIGHSNIHSYGLVKASRSNLRFPGAYSRSYDWCHSSFAALEWSPSASYRCFRLVVGVFFPRFPISGLLLTSISDHRGTGSTGLQSTQCKTAAIYPCVYSFGRIRSLLLPCLTTQLWPFRRRSLRYTSGSDSPQEERQAFVTKKRFR